MELAVIAWSTLPKASEKKNVLLSVDTCKLQFFFELSVSSIGKIFLAELAHQSSSFRLSIGAHIFQDLFQDLIGDILSVVDDVLVNGMTDYQ